MINKPKKPDSIYSDLTHYYINISPLYFTLIYFNVILYLIKCPKTMTCITLMVLMRYFVYLRQA